MYAAASPKPEAPRFQHDVLGWLGMYLYVAGWLIIAKTLPNSLDSYSYNALLFIGIIGTWRYGWWLINLARALLYGSTVFPQMRRVADRVWQQGWRPQHIHFLMTTFHERRETTHHFLNALVRELRREQLSGTLWIGFGAGEDERVIREWMKWQKHLPLEIVMVKQNLPGKRMAIGTILRALSRRGVGRDDIAYLMDGDSILAEGTLQKTLSIFGADPKLSALTTDEDAVVSGPLWVQKWLTMRFAQRRMWMQSHAISHRVLTLTGRMSAYRASVVVEKEFIRTVEVDTLNHWLWGSFRFLSGDDKSTWYCLLKGGGRMTYVPDAMVYTIEHIEGWGLLRMRDNLLRWSGNMLRNGMRAIALGPRRVPPFIWWCLIDQRISIWTVLSGFTAAMSITLFIDGWFIVTYLLWIGLTRFIMGATLFFFSDRIHISYPFLLYANQLLSAFLKVYIMFHLPRQRWANRQGQKGGDDAMNNPMRRLLAGYINGLYLAVMLFLVFLITGVLEWPHVYQLPL